MSLLEINAAQLAQRRWILRRKSKHVAVLFFSFVILLGGKILVRTGEMLLLGLFLLCASKTRDGHHG